MKKLLLIVMKSGDGKELFLDKERGEEKKTLMILILLPYHSHKNPLKYGDGTGSVS